jgi:cytochrome c peroxidase
MLRVLCSLALWLALAAPALTEPPHAATTRMEWKKLYERPEGVPFPDENPYSDAKASLGRMLYFDPILSGESVRSCASCHNPGLSWGDGLALSLGEGQKPMAVRAPSLLNVAWLSIYGWDGRFPDLESVAFMGPITSPAIMNRKESDLIAALSAIPGYRRAFAAAFPKGAITRETVAAALATFERTIVAGEAPFDRWIAGDEHAISESAKRGFDLFNSKAGCAECHSGWNFTDGAFYDIGTGKGDDIGRGRLFPNSPKLRYAFKVTSLRDVARRAPYMHDGSEPTLQAVIELYDRGGIDRPSRSELIKPLNLSAAEKADLLAFLETLTGDPAPFSMPALPR